MIYGYDDLVSELSGRRFFSIGKSLFGRDIFAVRVGTPPYTALIHAGIHARESVSSAVAMDMLTAYSGGGIIFVPMVNPDGAMLVKYGISSAPEDRRDYLLNINGSDDFSKWKANGRGVDINVNFDASWGGGRQNLFAPSSESYIGPYPESEPETRALTALTKSYGFTASLSLHTKGEVIYFGFGNCNAYQNYAKMIAEAVEYPFEETPYSTGGFKDWFLAKGFGAGFTVELGDDNLPHPIDSALRGDIYQRVRELPRLISTIGEELWKKNS